MYKLLCANFARLKKSKSFWICNAAMLLFSIGFCRIQYGYEKSLDTVFFSPYVVVGVLIAVFCSIFIGTEYSDGTIRNKLVVGHNRSSIYLANFVACAVAGILMNLVYLAATCALGIPLLGLLKTDFPTVLLLLMDGMLLTVACAAIFSLLSMLNQNKTIPAIIGVILAFAFIFFATYIYSRLKEPEFLAPTSVTISSDGHSEVSAFKPGELIPNPNYLSDSERVVFQNVMDFFPTNQALEIVSMETPNIGLMPLYSAIIIVVANSAGMFFFRRKDLK